MDPIYHPPMNMVEVEEWLRFTNVFNAWLALIDESYVNELKLCPGYVTDQSGACNCSKEREGVLLSSAMLCEVEQRLRVHSGRL